MIDAWYPAVECFLEKYKSHQFFVGALVSGSHITGSQTKNSDLDLHIVMSDKFHFREKGSTVIDGYLISYTIYPKHSFFKILEHNYLTHKRIIARFYAKGKIIIDDNIKTMEVLKTIALENLNRELPGMADNKIWNKKYVISSILDNLESLYENRNISNGYYNILYYQLLDFLFRNYSIYLQTDILNTIRSTSKLYRFLNDEKWKKDYYLPSKYPDSFFIKKFQECLENVSHKNIRDLSNYTIDKMGGFNKREWHRKNPVI